jgi:hypothetical protein
MRKIILALIIALSSPAYAAEYVKSSETTKEAKAEAQYKKDAYECKRDASQAKGSWHSRFLNSMEAEDLYDQCMDAKGYRKVEPKE